MKPSTILLDEYRYDLPDERIAKYPVSPRDSSKLLVYKNGQIAHDTFANLPNQLPEKSFLVFNDTKVIPARVYFRRPTGAIIEVFLLHPEQPTHLVHEAMQATDGCVWACMIGNKKRWKTEEVYSLKFAIGAGIWFELYAQLIDATKNWVRFWWKPVDEAENEQASVAFVEVVKALGEIPLPPYLNRQTEAQDTDTYQTVYSKAEGAVAAPTAGLHFTDNVFKALETRQISHTFITLHVGAGTFQPVKVANAVEHTMHSEQAVFDKKMLEDLHQNADNLIAVGTTSMRALESLYWFGVKLLTNAGRNDTPFFIEQYYPYQHHNQPLPRANEALEAIIVYFEANHLTQLVGETEIYIVPSYAFKMCKGLITNYHQPGSTLMLLVAAFVGQDWQKIYNTALANDYRFLSYGDSSLLLP
jgi:S-adenosylmethionine:tRNA ribosyltransferase-isomerase